MVSKRPMVVDATGRPKAPPPAPMRVERITPEIARDPDRLADLLTRISIALSDATTAARASVFNGYTKFEGVPCGSGGAVVTLRHGLGRPPMIIVTRFLGTDGISVATDRPDLREDPTQSDASTLVLKSYVAGVADVVLA